VEELTKYLISRLVQMIPVLLGVTVLTFSMVHLTPGDPVTIMMGERGATAEDIQRIRDQMGLNDPIVVQFTRFVWNAIRGDLGESLRSRRPVVNEIVERIPKTVELTVAAELLAVGLGVMLGIAAAMARTPLLETGVMVFALVGLSMPTFWSGLLFILFFSLRLGWLPITSTGTLQGLILPAATLALPAAAVLARMTRSSLLEVLRQDYVRTARSKGLSDQVVILRHALKNAFIPVMTIIGLQFGGLLTGTFIVETVFARPGLGRFTVNAILARDFPQVQAIVLVIAVIYVGVNLLTDVAYALLDPRIRYE
jgi:ABC-type dipeptide/oligopeptide/nickel transport system permease component